MIRQLDHGIGVKALRGLLLRLNGVNTPFADRDCVVGKHCLGTRFDRQHPSRLDEDIGLFHHLCCSCHSRNRQNIRFVGFRDGWTGAMAGALRGHAPDRMSAAAATSSELTPIE